jgi:hypothetical protein
MQEKKKKRQFRDNGARRRMKNDAIHNGTGIAMRSVMARYIYANCKLMLLGSSVKPHITMPYIHIGVSRWQSISVIFLAHNRLITIN